MAKPNSSLYKPGQSGNPEKKWKPGQTGNPKGRPKRNMITDQYFRLLKKKLTALNIDVNKDTIATAFAKAMLIQVIKEGNVNAAHEITQRVEGPVIAKVIREGIEEGLQIEARTGDGDLIAAISTIYGIRITDTRTGESNDYNDETVIIDIPASRSESTGDTEAATGNNATLSLPEAVDRGPEPPQDSE